MSCNSGKGIEFFTAVNRAYYHYALALEASLLQNAGKNITIFTINFDDNKPNHVSIPANFEDRMVGKFTHEAALCMRMRAFLFCDILKAFKCVLYQTMLIWIDADSIVRKPIDGLIDHIQDCNVTAKEKGPADYASGVVGIDTNAIGFAELYESLVRDDEHWKSDQRNLAKTIQAFDGKGFKPLPEIYCDTGFTDEGVIWTAKIKCHNDPKWLKEYEHYLPRQR